MEYNEAMLCVKPLNLMTKKGGHDGKEKATSSF